MWIAISVTGLAIFSEFMTSQFSPRLSGGLSWAFFQLAVITVIAVFVFTVAWVVKKYKAASKLHLFFNYMLLGALVLSSVFLFSMANFRGWLIPDTVRDEPRYTADGRFLYHIQLEYIHDERGIVTLFAEDIHNTHQFRVGNGVDSYGLLGRGPWGTLEATDNPQIYLFTLTEHPYFNSTLDYFVDFETGEIRTRTISPAASFHVGEFHTTPDKRFEYRLEHNISEDFFTPYLIYIKNIETEQEYRIFLPISISIADIATNSELSLLEEPISLTQTEEGMYILTFENRGDMFSVNLAEFRSERITDIIPFVVEPEDESETEPEAEPDEETEDEPEAEPEEEIIDERELINVMRPINEFDNYNRVAAGAWHTIILNSDGTVSVWEGNYESSIGVAEWNDIIEIAAGWHCVGLRTDGTVVAVAQIWDLNVRDSRIEVSEWRDIVVISANWFHTIGLRADGTVVTTEAYEDRDTSHWRGIIAISAGRYHNLGLKEDGTVVAVGRNSYNECDISDWNDIVAISGGGYHSVGLKADGTVVAVGDNSHGQCDVSDWRNIVAISAGEFHTVGLRSDGTVVAVGMNGIIYNDYWEEDEAFTQCHVSDWRDIVAISAGWFNTVGLRRDGSVIIVGGYVRLL
jgi:hypothetical protein